MSELTRVESLLEAHELIIVEREDARYEMEDTEFKRGHMNGLSEARNRVEQVLLSRVNQLECHKQENMAREKEEAIKDAVAKYNG